MTGSGATARVMTWNIHGGLGTDRRFDLTRVVQTITRHHPDVVALQEVDSRRTIAPASSAFAVLREAVGEHGVEAKSIIAPDGEYGQMVLSRWPLGAMRYSRYHACQARAPARHRSRSHRPRRDLSSGRRAFWLEFAGAQAASAPVGGDRSPPSDDDGDAR